MVNGLGRSCFGIHLVPEFMGNVYVNVRILALLSDVLDLFDLS